MHWISQTALRCLGLLAAVMVGVQSLQAAADGCHVLVDPTNSYSSYLLDGQKQMLHVGMVGWGPNWGWASVEAHQKGTPTELEASSDMVVTQQPKQVISIAMNVRQVNPTTVAYEYSLTAQQDVPLTMLVATIAAPEGGKAQGTLSGAEGSPVINLPTGLGAHAEVKSIRFTGPQWRGPVSVTFDPATKVASDGGLRVVLAEGVMKAGARKLTMTVQFPAEVTLVASDADMAKYAPVLTGPDWFAFTPKWDMSQSVIGLEDWIDKPAGKHGGVRMVGDHFQFEDGTPVKFWGTNLSYGASAPSKEDALFTAQRFAKYGVNAVRMHKFTGAGWEGIGDENDATQMKPDGMERLDNFCSQLAQHGIYYGWSHTYHFRIMPGNRDRVSGYDELMANNNGGDSYGVINWAEDVQDLFIERVVNLLKHKNPYTGKTYAEDPALSYIELQNEDDIFFYTSETAYAKFPTYRKLLMTRYGEWLKTKYGTQGKLADAWQGALKSGESLDTAASITVQANPWSMGNDYLPKTQGGERQRLLDNARFLHETQNRFYTRYVKAIRDAGYKGPLVGSPWIAPSMVPNLYNLRSDAMVGYVDRHDYFGEAMHDTMLNAPGSGYLQVGLQQVAGRPFGLSEWIHVYPSLYSAEGPVLIAAYGLGLQGWDASYEFQSTSARLTDQSIVGNLPWGVWNADAPTQIGQNPVLSRMVLRGDVTESPVISVRRVSLDDLEQGKFNFAEKIQQQGDVKTIAGTVPPESLAAGRALLEFVDKSTPSTFPDMAQYKQGNVITSATGQLKWDAGAGFITINTAGTQGYVGFAQGQQVKLDTLTIAPDCTYASILATPLERDAKLATGKRILVCAVARNANAGFRCLTIDGKTIVDNGKAPIMLEPVKARLTFPGRVITQVNILDHDGRPTANKAASQGDTFTIDGAKDHAIYYEVVLQ